MNDSTFQQLLHSTSQFSENSSFNGNYHRRQHHNDFSFHSTTAEELQLQEQYGHNNPNTTTELASTAAAMPSDEREDPFMSTNNGPNDPNESYMHHLQQHSRRVDAILKLSQNSSQLLRNSDGSFGGWLRDSENESTALKMRKLQGLDIQQPTITNQLMRQFETEIADSFGIEALREELRQTERRLQEVSDSEGKYHIKTEEGNQQQQSDESLSENAAEEEAPSSTGSPSTPQQQSSTGIFPSNDAYLPPIEEKLSDIDLSQLHSSNVTKSLLVSKIAFLKNQLNSMEVQKLTLESTIERLKQEIRINEECESFEEQTEEKLLTHRLLVSSDEEDESDDDEDDDDDEHSLLVEDSDSGALVLHADEEDDEDSSTEEDETDDDDKSHSRRHSSKHNNTSRKTRNTNSKSSRKRPSSSDSSNGNTSGGENDSSSDADADSQTLAYRIIQLRQQLTGKIQQVQVLVRRVHLSVEEYRQEKLRYIHLNVTHKMKVQHAKRWLEEARIKEEAIGETLSEHKTRTTDKRHEKEYLTDQLQFAETQTQYCQEILRQLVDILKGKQELPSGRHLSVSRSLQLYSQLKDVAQSSTPGAFNMQFLKDFLKKHEDVFGLVIPDFEAEEE